MYADDLIPDLRFSLSYLFEICLSLLSCKVGGSPVTSH